ncbi:hypothetical protein N9C30_00285 [bacterium]|nr:hypothetical protein [bacterium]
MSSLTVWARPGLPPGSLGNAILWEAFLPDDAPPDWISLPEYVHREKELLRSRYQSWLAGISQRELNGVTVAEFMSIRSNLSYWWMTLPTDNSLAADSPAYRVLRLFALTSVAERLKFDHVRVVTDRRAVAEAIALWADITGKTCTVDFSDPSMGHPNRHQRSRGPILAMLRVFWSHLLISMQPSRKAGRAATKEGIIFIDYLAHLQKPGLDGAFRSNYWGPLVELLEDWPEPVNWLHIPANYATPTLIRSDVDKCEAFNAVHPAHSLLYSYLGLKTVLRALRDYVQIRRFGKKLWRQRDLFVETGTRLDPSPLLHELVQDQYFGRTAALNAFWINLWESTIHALPMQRLGAYLFENQPWELAFLSAWQRSQFGKAFAVAHSTMRFWDLRYFSGNLASELFGRPSPDSIVVNGPLMRSSALRGGYPERLLSVAETLRSPADTGTRCESVVDILVLGEYDNAHDRKVIEIAKEFADSFEPPASVTYRSHPTAEVNPRSLPPRWSLSQHASVHAAVATSQIALCGPTTTAALDARLMGKRVFVIGLPCALTSSPAIGLPNVYLVTTEADARSLTTAAFMEPVANLEANPLCQGRRLMRWRHLLSSS